MLNTVDIKNKHADLELSIVIPVYNEVDNVRPLAEAIGEALASSLLHYEVLFIDDGSTDGTAHLLKKLQKDFHEVKVILFRNNFGQSAALAAGFESARGKVIVTMDGDLQNDPNDIPRMLAKLKEGYDVVSGWRKKRQDKFVVRRIPSIIANRIICSVTKTKLHDTGCAIKAYRREMIKRLHLYGELHRFLPALSKMEGARITEMVVAHHPRKFGRSKYNLSRTFRVLLDLLTLNLFMKYLKNPLRFFGGVGILLGMVSFIIIIIALSEHFIIAQNVENLNVLITLAFLFFAAGFQFVFFGLLGKLIVESGVRRGDYFFDIAAAADAGGTEE